MLALINASVIFAFGLVITGIVFLGILQTREQAMRAARAERTSRSSIHPAA